MKTKKVILSILVAALLVTSLFAYQKWPWKGNDKDSITANVQGPKTGPIGKWDIPIPEINPLGSQGLYASTSYEKGFHKINYIENFAENEKSPQGEVWTLEVEDPSGIPLVFLKEYAEKLGANIFSGAYGDRLSFTYKKDEDSLWWGDAFLNAPDVKPGYKLTVVKEPRVPAGKEVKLSAANAGGDEPVISFATQTEGNRFQSAIINIPSGALSLRIESENRTGILNRKIYYERELLSIKSNTFVLDDLPQGSDPLVWQFTWEPDSAPAEFTFKLEEQGEIPAVKYGDELGALKVCGVPFGNASVKAQNGVEYEYTEEYNTEGDITPEGDTLFWLPSGYWNVDIPSEGTGMVECMTRLVPVNAGEMTILTVPDSLSSAYSALSRLYADQENLTGGIEITETKDEGSTAVVSMLVNDPKDRDVFPSKENTTIIEGGQKVDILDITRQIAPPSVVLVLDSSGSMGKLMPATLESAKRFIEGLPDKTFVKVIDFDSEIRILKGETKDSVIKSLSSIKASGSTKLFDATLEGLKLLEGKNRPALVVFADGADSSVDGQGVGSSASIDEVTEVIRESGIPLYTIGFGDNADKQAMKDFASASKGEYYNAKDNKALDNVFAAIGSKFGNSFTMRYKRPTEAALSDIPVVTFIMDASGSMDTNPAEDEGCGYRIDKTKALFHDFVQKLPDQCLLQMISFQTSALGGPIISQGQITTNDKVKVLQAIGSMSAGGGTPVLQAIEAGYQNLKSVPTNKRIIIYVTDAGLEVDEEEQGRFEELLSKMKEEDIIVLWAGMGVSDREELFRKAAELSGGRYVVKEDVNDLKSTLEGILGLIGTEKGSDLIPISIAINEKTGSGDVFSYAASTDAEFKKPARSGKIMEPQVIKLSTGTPLKRYDSDTAALITGASLPGEETILAKRFTYNKKSENKAAEIYVKEGFYLDKFKGLEPPDGKQFLALQLEMKNITSDKIQYQIPSFNNHFFVTVNNEGSYPASNASWLTEMPISVPGNPEVNIFPDKNLSGMMVFLVPDNTVTQMSLHFYDTAYEHINIPLVGKMNPQYTQVNKLPTTAPVNVTDAFSMTVTGASVIDKIDIYKAAEKTTFKVIEADFIAKVQALLDIDPAKRLWLRVNTGAGPLMTKMSDATAALPFGFISPVMLAPSSANKVRLAYPVSSALSNTQAEIWGDVDSGSLLIPVTNGNPYGNAVNKPIISAHGLQLRVNQLTTLEGVENYHGSWAVADVTFTCPSGAEGAMIPDDMFCLVRDDYLQSFGKIDLLAVTASSKKTEVDAEAEEDADEDTDDEAPSDENTDEDSNADNNGSDYDDSGSSSFSVNTAGLDAFASADSGLQEGIILPDPHTGSILYGIDEEWGVYSGTQRRGLVLFSLPDPEHNWTLKSNYFTELNEPLLKGSYSSPDLLVSKTEIPLMDKDFESQLAQAVQKAILKYQSCKSSEGGAGFTKTMDFTQGDGKNYIPMPTIVTHGIEKMRSVKSVDQAISTLQTLKWLPSADENWNYRYSPEAVLTQGWGTEWDLGYLASGLIAKAGFAPKQRLIKLTEAGKAKLLETYPISEMKCTFVPGIAYVDEKGTGKLFVVPFMKDITELDGLVYITSDQVVQEYTPVSVRITVSAAVESKGDSAASLASDIGSVLGGGEGGTSILEDIELLSKEIQLPELSKDAIEVGYMEAGKGAGTLYMAAISTTAGVEPGQYAVDTGKQKILGVKIDVALPNGTLTHQTTLTENDVLDRMYHNIAINLPDLPSDASKSLQNATNKEYKAAQNPSSLSTLKWYGRNIINRFITAQTKLDNEIGEGLKLALGRTNKERCFVLTSRMSTKDNKLRTNMDLLQAVSQCHNGDNDTRAAYNIGAGLFASIMEGEALTGENKAGFLHLWSKASKETKLVLIPGNAMMRESMIEPLRKAGYPDRLISSVENNQNMILTLDRPVTYDGEKRWAWLEINPKTYETISVMDTGEHGSTEYLEILKKVMTDGGKFIVGAFMGIEVSVWAIADFSLAYDDYGQVIEAARQLTEAIGEHLSWVMKCTGGKEGWMDPLVNFSVSLGPYSVSVGYEKMMLAENLTDILFEAEVSQEILGFEQGYKAASEIYFRWAQGK